MRKMNKVCLSLCLLVALSFQAIAQDKPQLDKNTNQEVINAMNLEQKARLLVGMGMKIPGMPALAQGGGAQGPVVGSTQDQVPGAAGTTAMFEDLGIPTMVVADGPAGLRIAPRRPADSQTYYATAFPIATMLAASWDTELVYTTGQAMGNEVKEYGVDILLAPGMNIHRNPLGGRNFEYYSEDPLLTGKMAAAMVKGIQSNGVGTSIKHFAANNHETNRNTINVKVSERALREIYLRGFEIAVKEAQPWTVMSSYNKINGVYTSESADLLKKILRQDWGFQGFVMTDWFGGKEPVEQVKAGNDLIMPGTIKQLEAILKASKNKELDEKLLDENVNCMLNIIKKTPAFQKYKYSNKPNLKEHAAVARQAATGGMVLLKNNNQTLPLKPQSIAVFGNYSFALVSGGTGSGDVNEAYTVTLPEGLQNAGFTLDIPLQKTYEQYLAAEKAKQPKREGFIAMFMPPPVIPEMAIDKQLLKNALAGSKVAIITLGRIAGEGGDRKTTDDYYLTAAEKNLIKTVSDAFHKKGKKVIVVLNVGGVIETASWRDMVDGILLAWLPGQEAGNAIADILSGKVNPSGKLPTSFLVKYEDDPAAIGFPGMEYGEAIDMGFQKVRPAEIEYPEGVFVGYRAFDKKQIKPAYEFGYGLSYTSFAYSNLTLSSSNFTSNLAVSVTVKNTGSAAGKEVVQLYLSAPGKTMEKPMSELKGFAKTNLLQPGDSQTLTFELDARALASFDEIRSAWVAEPGKYTAKIGASSRDIKLSSEFTVAQEIVVETVNKALPMK
ncbi:MAG: glycoside hydrolase family 3 C-terminal domain-containing protein [Saprospiraceae bacterium]|jgi:beta-glucosidase|nr:glycoside hydrolase family 3 C-terminal domain-containing protein [Saprospiraceae bacterium]